MPLKLAQLHQDSAPGGTVDIRLRGWSRSDIDPLIEGAGFRVDQLTPTATGWTVRAIRERTLPDLVTRGLRLLVCGLNPSLYAADVGVHYARPGNRFWPAALAAGAVSRDRDPWHAVRADGIGWSDLVKRATVGAAELTAAEYAAGVRRLAWTVELVEPAAICFVGLAGWRVAVDRRAQVGVQPGGFCGVPAYLMPSTSGLNAHTRPADFVEHFRAALALGPGSGALSART